MRNAEVIRQWSILRDLESSRRATIDDLAQRTGVTTRTIRRDLEALQSAGLPALRRDPRRQEILDARAAGLPPSRRHRLHARGDDGAVFFALARRVPGRDAVPARRAQRVRQARRRADAGHAAVPRSAPARHAGEGGPGQPVVRDDSATPATASKQSAPRSARVAQLLDATLHHRRVAMRYHSFSSNREKDYVLEPYRLVFAQGGLYVVGLRAGVQAAPHVRGRAHSVAVGHGRAVRARGSAGGRVRAFARASIRARRNASRSRSSRGSPATSRSACGIRRSKCRRRPTAR